MSRGEQRDQSNRPTLDVLVQRQLDVISSGNGAYLETFLTNVKRAGFDTRVVFAPEWSFGNRPWASIHPRMKGWIDHVVWPAAFKIGETYWSSSPRVWTRFAKRFVKEALIRMGFSINVPSYLGHPLSRREALQVAKICNAKPADVTIAEYSSMGPVLKDVTSGTKKGVLMHDVLSDRAPRFRANGREPDFTEVSRQTEADWCAQAEVMIYASANEMENFSSEVPGSDSVWLRPEPPEYSGTPDSGTPHVMFIGTTHAGNHDALDHFIDDIWPLILEKRPDTEFLIIGSVGKHLTPERSAAPGIKLLGRVDRLEDYGGQAAVGIAPTRLATGVSIKVVEYLMLDMTCVAYPLALEGFGPALDPLVYAEDSVKKFADRVVSLLDDDVTRKQSADNAQRAARDALSNEDLVNFLKQTNAMDLKRDSHIEEASS